MYMFIYVYIYVCRYMQFYTYICVYVYICGEREREEIILGIFSNWLT
jgi:hypothetical protein